MGSSMPYAVRRPLRWAFYALIASLPLERVYIGLPVTLSHILGAVFLVLVLSQPKLCFQRPPLAFWCFAAYVLLYTVLTVLQPLDFWGEILDRVFTLFQLLILFWIAGNLLRDPRVARGSLLALGFSCAACALLQVSGFATADPHAERIAAFGQNANDLSCILALGLLGLVGLRYGQPRNVLPFGLGAWLLFVVLGLAIVQTNSRGGLLALGSGLVVLLLAGTSRALRVRNALILTVGAALLVGVVYRSEEGRRRWEESLATGNLAHREQLYPVAWGMFLEKPVAGWGPITALYELGARTHFVRWPNPEEQKRDTHNLVLHVLISTGLLGAIPLGAGLWLCLRAAFRARRGLEGTVPLALTISLLVSNMSGDRIYMKTHWLILAYAVASGYQFAVRRRPDRPVPQAAPPRQVVLTPGV